MSTLKWQRYPEYKESDLQWFPEIPIHWDLKRMQWIGKFSASGIDKKSVGNESDCLMVNYTDVYGNETAEIHSDMKLMKTTATSQKVTENHLKKGDMLFTPSSETTDDIGVSAVAIEDMPGIVYSYHLTRFRPSISLGVEFSKFFCNSTPVLSQLSAVARGTTRQILSRHDFNTLKILIPPKEERKNISHLLSEKNKKITSVINYLENNHSLLQEKRSALITKAVTKGLNPDMPMKDSGIDTIGMIPEHWKSRRIKHLCTLVKDGTHSPPSRVDHGIPLLSVRNIIDGQFVFREDDSKISFQDYLKLCKPFTPTTGDVLLAVVGATMGKVAIIGELSDFHIQRSLAIFRLNHKIMDNRFMCYSMQSNGFQAKLWENSRFSAQPGIYLGALNNFKLQQPPLEEQVQIVNYIESKIKIIDEGIKFIRGNIDNLNEYRTSLISAAVTGKIDVRGLA